MAASFLQFFEAISQISIWQHVTRLGSASLLFPIITLTVVVLWRSNQQLAVRIFIPALITVITMTLISKIMFLGWGIGIASIDFTGISGHTVLATAVLPILCSWIISPSHGRFRYLGEFIGLLLALDVGLSRIILGAHSSSEVFAGWIFGLIVCGITLNALKRPIQIPNYFRYIAFSFIFMINLSTTNYLPTHDWEIKLALMLSGHEVTFTRRHA